MSSKSMNCVFLMGHLGQKPELQQSKSGHPYTRLSVATSRWQRSTEAPEGEEKTDWHSVFVWGKEAELCTKNLQKGSLVLVEGSLTYWQVANSAAPYKNAVHGHKVRFLNFTKALTAVSDEAEILDIPEEARNHNAVAHL